MYLHTPIAAKLHSMAFLVLLNLMQKYAMYVSPVRTFPQPIILPNPTYETDHARRSTLPKRRRKRHGYHAEKSHTMACGRVIRLEQATTHVHYCQCLYAHRIMCACGRATAASFGAGAHVLFLFTLSSSLVLDLPAMPQVTPAQPPSEILRARCLHTCALRTRRHKNRRDENTERAQEQNHGVQQYEVRATRSAQDSRSFTPTTPDMLDAAPTGLVFSGQECTRCVRELWVENRVR